MPSARRPFTRHGCTDDAGQPGLHLGPARRQLRRLADDVAVHVDRPSTPRPARARSPRRSSAMESAPRPARRRCRGSAGRCHRALPPRAVRRPPRGRRRRHRCGRRDHARPRTDATEHERARRVVAEAVHVEALADAHTAGLSWSGSSPVAAPATRRRAQTRSSGTVTLRLSGSPSTTSTRPPTASTNAASSVPSPPGGVRVPQDVGSEGLGRLHGHEAWTDPASRPPAPVVDLLDGVGQGDPGHRPVGAAAHGVHDPLEQALPTPAGGRRRARTRWWRSSGTCSSPQRTDASGSLRREPTRRHGPGPGLRR